MKNRKFPTNPETNQKKENNLLENYHNSLKLFNSQFANLENEIKEKDILIKKLKTSICWRITLPIRIISYIFRGKLLQKYPLRIVTRRIFEIYQADGYLGVYDRFKLHFTALYNFFKDFMFTKKQTSDSQTNIFIKNSELINHYQFDSDVASSNYSLILIIAEVTLPQCYKYRVQQKVEHLERLGWIVKVVDWREQKRVLSILQICHDVIFYRVPAFPNVLAQINETIRLGLNPWWEVDDLIIDIDRYAECGFMNNLSEQEKDLLFFGADLFRKTMLSCQRAIASTTALAEVMYQAGVPEVYVIENALDQDTLDIVQKLSISKSNSDKVNSKPDEIIIIYGSGTNTHNADFLVAAVGIVSALKQEKKLQLWIVGELELLVDFQDVIDQIRYIPSQSYERYLELLAQADIAIAPLEPILFNDAKSNIKYLEASILGIPSICSSRQAFREVIQDQENGLLVNTSKEWAEKILLLAKNADLRKSIGQQAYKTVLEKYSPQRITTQQVEPIFGRKKELIKKQSALKILIVNLYFDPCSFGGATFVAEEMAKRVHQNDDVEVTVFTSRTRIGEQRGLSKYETNGLLVYSVDISSAPHVSQQFNNIEIIEPFELVLEAVQPDIVHFHSIQNMGLQMLLTCQAWQIPYVITLHDSWWLCNRQFMVKENGKYCFQSKIDLRVCQGCEPNNHCLTLRAMMMKQGLQAASLLLSPSETHRQLYIANDIDEALIKVNRNGIVKPKIEKPSRSKNTPIRFGFVAGDEVIKGALVIQKTFKSLSQGDWELKIIDSKVNMGYSPIDVSHWRVKGKVITVPPYNAQSKDDFFYGIDVLLFPSLWKESYGMTVREALLRDVWVICSHPGGQSEDVVDGVNGNYISLSGSHTELKQVIENLLDNASMFDDYVNPHKDHIATLEEQAEELLGYYRQIKEDTQKSTL